MSRLATHCPTLLQIRWNITRSGPKLFRRHRTYATHKDHSPSSLLTQQFDQQRKTARGADSVGPFQLGIVQPSSQKVKKWSELSTGGKVLRTTARTTNFSVILLGAGLSAVLVYVLTSELFSKNSPTVLYGNACERIEASPLVNRHLRAPLSFHNNPPSTHRPRHRNRHVNYLHEVDSTGKEHILINFYVQGSDPLASPVPSDPDSFVDRVYDWTSSKMSSISGLTFDGAVAWTKATGSDALRTSQRAFAYLVGEPLPPSISRPPPPPRREVDSGRTSSQDSPWSLSGISSRLTGKRRAVGDGRSATVHGTLWSTGEVHADFVKDENDVFVYRYLFVDIPDSSARNPLRLHVARTDGTRDVDGMLRWS